MKAEDKQEKTRATGVVLRLADRRAKTSRGENLVTNLVNPSPYISRRCILNLVPSRFWSAGRAPSDKSATLAVGWKQN